MEHLFGRNHAARWNAGVNAYEGRLKMDDSDSDMVAFESAMLDAGYDKPQRSEGGAYLYERDADRYVGWQLAAER